MSEPTRLHPVEIGAMNKRLSEARIRAEIARQARLEAGEPTEYWINVWWDRKNGEVCNESTCYRETDALDEINTGYAHMDYLHTIHISKTDNPLIRNSSAFNMEDEAATYERGCDLERQLERQSLDDERRFWEQSR